MIKTITFNNIIIIFALILGNCLYGQDFSKENVYEQDYEGFKKYLFQIKSDSIKKLEAVAFLKHNKTKNNPIGIADGYLMMSEFHSRTPLAIVYADSVIKTTINLKHPNYPARGYLQKGIQSYYLSKHNEAFEHFKAADDFAKKNNNNYQQLVVRHYIGLLKNITNGQNDETLHIFRENLAFFEGKEHQERYNEQYLKSLYALTDAYNRNNKLDSALLVIKRGIVESQKSKNTFLYNHFLIGYGRTKIIKEEYDLEVIDSLKKASRMIGNSQKSVANCYQLISAIYAGRKNTSEAIHYLKKVDSMYLEAPELIFQMQYACEELLKHYTTTKDDMNKLITIDKLIVVNETIIQNFQNLGKTINEEYDTPKLLAEKDRLLNSNRKTSRILYILAASLLVLLLYFWARNRRYKKRFEKLISKREKRSKHSQNKNNVDDASAREIGLSKEQLTSILEKLNTFEESQNILKTKYTLHSLAKELETNSAYLSKVINGIKGMNFANYLNNLRVDLIMDRLTNDSTLRSYTIEAIANEAGFNNAQSFSLAFHKKTGLYPSYFIKQLGQQK